MLGASVLMMSTLVPFAGTNLIRFRGSRINGLSSCEHSDKIEFYRYKLLCLPFLAWAVLVTVTYFVYAPVPARCPSVNWLRTLRLYRKI